METIKNVTQLLVAKDVTASAGEGAVATALNVGDGAVVVTDLKNVIINGASLPAGLSAFKLIANAGGTLIHSDIVSQGDVKTYAVTTTAAEAQQVDYIGSNGTAGALDEIASNIYTVRLYVQGSTITDFMQQKIKEGFYKSNTAAASYSQEVVATGLYDSLIANFSREPEEEIRFGRVNAGSRVAAATGLDSVTFTQGSKTVSATDVDNAVTNAALAVGEWIGPAVAVTTPLYKIVSIDATGNTLQLDRPFKEASVTILDPALGRISVAGDFGVKLTGIDRGFKVGYFKSAVVQWKTTIDFGDNQVTTVDESVSAYPGIGTSQQVASLEKELQADNHVYRSHVEGGVIDRAQVDNSLAYDMCVVEYQGDVQSGLGVDVKSPKSLQVAFESNTAVADDANTGVVVTLDAIFAAWAVPGVTAQVGNLTA